MTTRSRPSVFGLMRGVAGLSILLSGFGAEAGPRTVAGLLGVGLGLWAFDLWSGPTPDEDDAVRGRAVVISALAAMLALELGAFALAAPKGLAGVATFYGVMSVFQIAAIATAARCGPDDVSLVAWGSCHGAASFSAAVSLLAALALRLSGRLPTDTAGLAAGVLGTMTFLSMLFFGMAFLLLMAALAVGLLLEPDRRRRAWMSLILAQAAMLGVFLRWPWAQA